MDSGSSKNNINGNIFTREFGFSPVNPFNAKNDNQINFAQKPTKRLNGYDSTILNNSKFYHRLLPPLRNRKLKQM